MYVILGSGCSTQHLTSGHSSSTVAACIAKEWEQCGMSGFKVPVMMEKQTNSYFVGIAVGSSFYQFPSGLNHSSYPVWAGVTNTAGGSETVYHRAYQIFHGRIDRAVRKCQEPE
jgi:hypothetical protein